MFRFFLLALLSLIVSACVSPEARRNPWPYPEPPSNDGSQPDLMPGVPAPRTEPGRTDPSRTDPRYPRSANEISGPAVQSLLKQADQQLANGSPDAAAAALERAQRIEPRNPFVWQSLARVRLEQGQAEQAESLATKSSSLARGNPYIEADNWRLIAEARRAQGQHRAANEALVQAQRIEQSGQF